MQKNLSQDYAELLSARQGRALGWLLLSRALTVFQDKPAKPPEGEKISLCKERV